MDHTYITTAPKLAEKKQKKPSENTKLYKVKI